MKALQQPVGILGGGAFGTTLAHLVGSGGHQALLWVRSPETAKSITENRVNEKYLPEMTLSDRIRVTNELDEVAEQCKLILIAIPSASFRKVANALGNKVQGDHVLVSATKGLERSTFLRMTEVLREETCCLKIGAISGPNLALEIMRGVPGATVVASGYEEVIRRVEHVLHGPTFRIYASRDVVGAELAGATKNIIAIAGGVVRGLGYGDNTLSLLITRGLSEMARLGVQLGADERTYSGLAGVGDLVVTATSELSRNHRVGRRLAKGGPLKTILKDLGQVAEGVPTARVVKEWATQRSIPLPICDGVYRLIYEQAKPQDVLQDLMRLPSLYETEYKTIVPTPPMSAARS